MLICMRCGQENQPGATFCGNRDCGAVLEWEGQRVDSGGSPPAAEPDPATTQPYVPAAEAAGGEGRLVAVATALNPTVGDVVPGQDAHYRLHIRNQGNIADRYQIEIHGPLSGWARSEPAALALEPGADDAVTLRFSPPQASQPGAGTVPFRVQVTSMQDPSVTAVEGGTVTVAPYSEVAGELIPTDGHGRRSAKYELAAENRGNSTENLTVAVSGGRLDSTVEPASIVCEPGAGQAAEIIVRAPARMWFGDRKRHPFTVTGTREGEPTPEFQLQGSFQQVPVITGVLALVVAIPVALAVLALVAWLFILDRDVEVPEVRGMTQEAAGRVLDVEGLALGAATTETSEQPEGTVIDQDPQPDAEVDPETPVDIVLAEPLPLPVPDLVGQGRDAAELSLLREGFEIGEERQQESEEPEGTVIGQDPEPGAEADPDTPVDIIVASPPPVPEDERCTDEIMSNERWVCLLSASFDDEGSLVIEYEAEWAGSEPDRSSGFHIHLYGGDGTDPPDEIMGTHAPQPRGTWVIEDRSSPLTYPVGDGRDELLGLVSGEPKVCARIANGAHELVPDSTGDGTFTTGNCAPIQR